MRGLILPVLLLVLWDLATRTVFAGHPLLPAPAAVVGAFLAAAGDGSLARDLSATLARDLGGFAIAVAIGLPLGTWLGLSRIAARLVAPGFDALRQIAVFAWIPLISMWFGVGEAAKLAFIALAALVPVVLNTASGVAAVPARHLEVAAVLRFGPLRRFGSVILPAAAPAIATGLHQGLIYAWLGTIGAEYFMTVGPGIGGLMSGAREHMQMEVVILGVVLLGALGTVQTLFARRLTRLLTRYPTGAVSGPSVFRSPSVFRRTS
ncbi:ABC transporter permease subunit [Tistrella mobilis]|uniref:ABC transporter permease n=1 Tax=Tistrella mobilis TaxID=171437 RepID=UPI0035571729